MKLGAFSFVLHSHLPFYRQAGRWPHGEEVLHEAMCETYIPLAAALLDLADEGVAFRLTLGVTPILAEQLADPLVHQHFDGYVANRLTAAAEDRDTFERQGNAHFVALADYYRDFYNRARDVFNNRLGRNILGAFKRLQDAGYIEILTSAATHGYLPLLERDSSVYAQLTVGRQTYRRHFGREPRAIWLPECAYRPAFVTHTAERGGYVKPGIERFLAEQRLELFFTETHAVEGGGPQGKAGGDAAGYAPIPDRLLVPIPNYVPPTQRSSFRPYTVGTSDVAVLARNARTGGQVWAASVGYPGDPWYREFHRKALTSGIQYWRVSENADLGSKQPYNPAKAQERVREHARHFAGLVVEELAAFNSGGGHDGIVASAYDTELFGHWWFEGVDFLKATLREIARRSEVDMVKASDWLESHPPDDRLALPEGSWGEAGTHNTWLNKDTESIWQSIHAAERRAEQLVARQPRAEGDLLDVLNQAARELLLAQASDWEFLVTTTQAPEYSRHRISEHLAWFNDLAMAVEMVGPNSPLDEMALMRARAYAMRDNPFPDIDYRIFAARE